MFEDVLPSNWNTYATTSSNSTYFSYACYYDKELFTYLGDVYSVMWMEVNLSREPMTPFDLTSLLHVFAGF